MNILEIDNLTVTVGGKEVLRGLNLCVKEGEFHTIMGPNGSGKSTLAKTILGHPDCNVVGGDIRFYDKSIVSLPTSERSRLGLFLAFQNPVEVDGVKLSNMLFQMAKRSNASADVFNFKNELNSLLDKTGFNSGDVLRDVNKGFSGGERKRGEILQLLVQKPKFIILDEIDSGLDIDTMKKLAGIISDCRKSNMGGFVITHYNRLLLHLPTDFVHVLKEGRIVKSGGSNLALEVETSGFLGV